MYRWMNILYSSASRPPPEENNDETEVDIVDHTHGGVVCINQKF